uniref:Uncharacterized protein n=1 Tax=Zea mays TaxID=4577 RepID=B4FMQ5_MAIZE|nr:unknown [Zea mays]
MGTQHRHVLVAMPTGNISIARICVLLGPGSKSGCGLSCCTVLRRCRVDHI